MTMSSDAEASTYDPSYREQDVDDTLEEHDLRIRRLEKVALVGLGYGLSQGGKFAGDILQFVI